MSEVTLQFLTQAIGWMVVPMCKKRNSEGVIFGGRLNF